MGIQENQKSLWRNFHGPNLGYVVEQYERYANGTENVDPALKELFIKWGSPLSVETSHMQKDIEPVSFISNNMANMKKTLQVAKLLEDIRTHGHLAASINPLGEKNKEEELFHLSKYDLTEEDLKAVPSSVVWENAPKGINTAADAVQRLKELYTSTLAYEFSHVHTKEEKVWLTQMIEKGYLSRSLSKEEQISLLKRLTAVEGFEQFLHKTFVGQKRFSIEGVDTLVPILDEVIRNGNGDGVGHVMIGMAHRGRLSVLAHVLAKPYNNIFAEFLHTAKKPLPAADNIKVVVTEGWTGDVKYHLGQKRVVEDSHAHVTRITLANNPSHLEFVDPVVEGYTRAAQENRSKSGYPEQDVNEAFAILVHGDAAFPGQGIVAETLNLGGLKGYQTGGTIHIIANNLVGFTTDSHDSRSTRYASDLAKGFEIPIVHVNADDPEACLAAAYLAYQYRVRFKKDFLIDLVGYRRFGHNEMDDPMVTQPQVYKEIVKHPTVRVLYAARLQENIVLSQVEVEQINNEIQAGLQAEYDLVANREKDDRDDAPVPDVIVQGIPSLMKTGLPADMLRKLNRELLQWPEEFNVYPKLKKILERRASAFEEGGKVEWALAEALAFATILQDGKPIRLTGQDSERGTFAQRHIVLHDLETNETYSPLHRLPHAKASFAIHNSPLSEAAVVGFEYGYNVFAPETLVLWEAQYGDFANTAQALFDQFVSAGRAKWGQKSGLVLLLPHGYEGQGPEHSSARPERFLQLAAENNWTVANLTSAAQYFHILRRQAASLETEYVRPLVIMTPKSLLRNPLTASPAEELSSQCFQTMLEQPKLGGKAEKVKRLILTTGKIAIDLAAAVDAAGEQPQLDEIHILRVEQLYPFPKEKIEAVIKRYPNLEELVWVQEEPKNMGAWHFIAPTLYDLAAGRITVGYIGRPDRSSPSGGDPALHKKEQDRIVKYALKQSGYLCS